MTPSFLVVSWFCFYLTVPWTIHISAEWSWELPGRVGHVGNRVVQFFYSQLFNFSFLVFQVSLFFQEILRLRGLLCFKVSW